MTSIQSTQEFGMALRAARKQLGLTQPQLGLAAGVGVRFIVELEAGKPTVQLAAVMRVVAALGGVMHLSGLPSAAAQASPPVAVSALSNAPRESHPSWSGPAMDFKGPADGT
jgi:HTH-type transcriptional regulator / antitoxin HipB